MFKCIFTFSICILGVSCFAQNIDIAKKPKLSEADKEILEDEVMSDKFVVTEPAFRIDEPLENQLFSLDSLISIAEELNPTIDIMNKVVEREKANHAHQKVEWTRNIYGTGFYFQGNNNALITATNTDASASTSLSNGARYGLTVQVPLYEFVGRKRRNKIAKLNFEAEELRIGAQKREIAREVAIAYGNLISAQKLFLIAADGLQSSAMNRDNAQNLFEKGAIEVSELSRILEIDLRIRTDFEKARAAFYLAFQQFEIVVGRPIEELVK